MKSLFFIALFLLSSSIYGADCATMVPFGKPVVTATEKVTYLCRRMYVLEHSPSRHTAYWSAEQLVGNQQTLKGKRKDAFRPDPELPQTESAQLKDYKDSGYDRGHLAPVGDMYADAYAMRESFFLSNIIPQHPGNNENGWKALEELTRELAVSRKNLFVISGPVYKYEPTTIGLTRVAVPTHIYKIIYDPHSHSSMSFLVPNVAFSKLELNIYISTIAEIESIANIKFFPKSPRAISEATKLWTLNK